jgi:hypothetical protein
MPKGQNQTNFLLQGDVKKSDTSRRVKLPRIQKMLDPVAGSAHINIDRAPSTSTWWKLDNRHSTTT